MEQSVIYCPKCGTAIKPGTRFCPKCGTEVRFVPGEPTPGENTPSGGGGTATVTRVTPQTVTTAKGPGKKGPIIAIAAVALVLVLVIVGVVAFHGRSASKEDETPTAEAETEQTPEAAEDEAGGEDAAVGEDAEAENTYIGYLDKALNAALSSEETCDEISEEYNDENADTLEEYDRYVGVYTDLYDEIEGYRSEAWHRRQKAPGGWRHDLQYGRQLHDHTGEAVPLLPGFLRRLLRRGVFDTLPGKLHYL